MTSVTLKSYAKQREAEILKRLRDGMNRAVLIVENQAKLNVSKTSGHPQVQTGRLRASITSKVDESGGEITGQIGTNVYYGRHLEFGEGMPTPYPWLFPAVEMKKREIKDALKGSRFGVR